MFNTYATTNLKVNGCSGGICKTYLESWFERFHLKSQRAGTLLNKNSYQVVLQMVVCGDMEVIAEVIEEKDLKKYLNNKKD